MAKLRDGARQCAELYTALRDGARHCNSALSLSFLLRILSGEGRQGALAAPERIRSKNERDSVHFYSVAHHLVAPRKSLCTESLVLLRILSGAGRQGALAAPERIRSKNERDSVHCYSVAHHLVTPRKALCNESCCEFSEAWPMASDLPRPCRTQKPCPRPTPPGWPSASHFPLPCSWL